MVIKIITIITVIFLFSSQLFFTLNSQSQIRYEELAESVRNVFWLEQGRVYDGVSSNVGWYGSLLLIYKLFGFNLHTAQFFKLALYLVSISCLALLLKKYVREAWLPLLVIGLSPTLLYYNTSQTSHGIDLLHFPIVLFLLLQKKWWVQALGWAVGMVAWMSYPTFIFYLPALVFLNLRGVLRGLVAFLAPLIVAVFFIQNRSLLFFDPQLGSGIFRGAGSLSLESVPQNLAGIFTDLFIKGSSYHFEVNQAEFSLIFPLLALGLVLYNCYKNYNHYNRYIWLVLVSGLAVLVLSSLTLDPSGNPGMRRYTPVLAAFYTLFVIAWHANKSKWIKFGLGLLLIHHLIVYPINLAHLKDPSPSAYPIWFNSFDSLIETVQKQDLKLVCEGYCRVSEVYAAVAGSCAWNKLNCHQILGFDTNTGKLIPLTTELWDSYYFEH